MPLCADSVSHTINVAEIFLLEDDKLLSHGIGIALGKDGNAVTVACDCREARRMLAAKRYDLFILDINLPDGSGADICEEIKKSGVKSPIVFLTAKDTEADMLAGFSLGCDDYISKPFSVSVLRQKILAILRRGKESESQEKVIEYKKLRLYPDAKKAVKNGEPVALTATEYKLLEYLAVNKGRVLTRSMILENIWDIDGNFIDENTLSVQIKRLRAKIEDNTGKPEYIVTVFGIGYTFGE